MGHKEGSVTRKVTVTAICAITSISRSPRARAVPHEIRLGRRGNQAFDPIRLDEIQYILPQDAIPALIKPAYQTASQALDINDRERVIGVVIDGEARAHPLATMSAHEIVDDEIGGQPIAVTW